MEVNQKGRKERGGRAAVRDGGSVGRAKSTFRVPSRSREPCILEPMPEEPEHRGRGQRGPGRRERCCLELTQGKRSQQGTRESGESQEGWHQYGPRIGENGTARCHRGLGRLTAGGEDGQRPAEKDKEDGG